MLNRSRINSAASLVGFLLSLALIANVNAATPQQVPIHIDVAAEPVAWPTPCTVGVPFSKGALPLGTPVKLLDSDGNALPIQTRAHATWNPDGSHGVRWLLLDFQAPDKRPLQLTYGQTVKPTDKPAPNIAILNDGVITIDTGILKTTCPTNQLDPWAALTINSHLQIDTSQPYGPTVTHEKRGMFMAVNDRNASVELEENGPLRATLKASGWYVNEAGEKFGRYQIRLHFFRNQPDVKMQHTFIFTGDSDHDRIAGLTVAMPLKMHGRIEHGAIPLEQYPGASSLNDFKSLAHWSVVSDRADNRTLTWEFKDLKNNNTIFKGEKNAGFIGMRTDAHAGLIMVLKDAWQQAPFEVELEGATLRMHLWPAHGRVMDLSFDGMWQHLTEEQKLEKASRKAIKHMTPEEKLAWCREAKRSGIAKTHEVWLLFRHDNINLYASHASQIDNPVLAVVDPAWACATKALMQTLHPYDTQNFRDEEAYLASILDLRLAEREAGKIYGFFDFGGYHQLPFVRGRNLDAGIWHRARPKSHYGWSTFAPVQYLRTGDRKYLRYAQEYSGYAADRTYCYHDHFETKDFRGGEYHYNNSEIGWIGGTQWASVLQGKEDAVYLYWMTGDRRLLDALEMWAEGNERYEAGEIPWDTLGQWFKNKEKHGPYTHERRQLGALLQRWSILYAATWDPRWKAHADRIAEGFRTLDLSRDDPKDYSGYLQYHASWTYEGLDFYHQVTGDAQIAKALEALCQQAMQRAPGFVTGGMQSGCFHPYSFGFLLTGDTDYLRLGRHALLHRLEDWASPEALGPRGKWSVQTLPRLMGAIMKAPPTFREANLPTHQRGLMMAWPQAHRAFFLEEQDQPIDITITSHWGGQYVLFDPAGEACAELHLSYDTSLTGSISVKADGKTGTYTLQCVEVGKPPYASRPWDYPAFHTVLHSTLKKVVYELPATNSETRPIARKIVMMQLPDESANITLQLPFGDLASRRPDSFSPLDGQGPHFDLGAIRPVGNGYHFTLPTADSPRLWEYALGMREGNISTAFQARSGGYVRTQGFAPFVTTSPDTFFMPH